MYLTILTSIDQLIINEIDIEAKIIYLLLEFYFQTNNKNNNDIDERISRERFYLLMAL